MFLPFLCTNPKLMEGSQARKDAPSQPTCKFTFCGVAGGVQSYFLSRKELLKLIVDPIAHALHHRPSSGQHDMTKEGGSKIRLHILHHRCNHLRDCLRPGNIWVSLGRRFEVHLPWNETILREHGIVASREFIMPRRPRVCGCLGPSSFNDSISGRYPLLNLPSFSPMFPALRCSRYSVLAKNGLMGSTYFDRLSHCQKRNRVM